MRQQNLFEFRDEYVRRCELTSHGVDQALAIVREVLSRATSVTFGDIVRTRMGLPLSGDIPEEHVAAFAQQKEALKTSRLELKETLEREGLMVTTITHNGRSSFGAGRADPVGFTTEVNVSSAADSLQARTAFAKIQHVCRRQFEAGTLTSAQLMTVQQGMAQIAATVFEEPLQLELVGRSDA